MNKIKSNNKLIWFYFIILALLVIDQLTKYNFSKLGYGESIPVIGTFLQFTHVENPGMAFGIQFGWAKIFLSLFSIIASAFLIIYLAKIKTAKLWVKIGIAFVAAGAMGNGIDRVFYGILFDYGPLFYGKVIDWVQVDIPDIDFLFIRWSYFPIFNVADSSITIGACILILMYKHLPFLEKKTEESAETTENIIKKDTFVQSTQAIEKDSSNIAQKS
jgi:signal peptidase II